MALAVVTDPDPSEIVGTFSYSRLDKWLNCPQAYAYSYIEELTPKLERARHFEIGTYAHELFHVYFHLLEAGYHVGDDFVYTSMLARINNDLQRFAGEGLVLETEVLDIVSKVVAIITRYINMQSVKIDAGIKILGVEEVFEVPFRLPSGRIVLLNGIIDLIYRTLRGWNIIRDHKTGKDTRYFAGEKIRANKQLWFYSVAKHLQGLPIHGFEISFASTRDYKTKPTVDQLFQRFPYEIPEGSLEIYARWLGEQIDALLDGPIYKRLHEGCTNCNFWPLCKTELSGSPITLLKAGQYKKKEPHALTQKYTHGEPAEETLTFDIDF